MVTKLIDFANKNAVFSIFIRIFCYIAFGSISIWNELMGIMRVIGVGGKTYASLKQYKNKYIGKRCFIIATGPSLTLDDLNLLKNEITFGMNSITKIYQKTDFRPTFYGIQDHIVYDKMENEILKYYENENNVFVSDRIKWHSKIGKNWNIFPLNMSYHAYKRWFHNEFFAKFSSDIYRIVYSGFSITYSLIEIAVYMGFKEIYLIGADCNFSKTGKNHFAEHGVIDTTIDTARERNITGYEVALAYAETHDISIINATRGGELEVFKRKSLEEIVR